MCAPFSPRKYKSILRGLRLLRSYICFVVFLTSSKLYFGWRRSDILAIAKVAVNPQRAKGTHRAIGASLLPTGKYIASSLLQSALHGILINKHPFGCLNIVLPKRQNFDEITGFLTGSCEGAYASQILLLTKQTLFIRLFVFCSFAPSPQKYKSIFWGPLPL